MKGVALCGDGTIELTTHEVLLLRFTCDLIFDDESAFGPLVDRPDPELLQRGARTLVEKGLADRKTYRPHRELLRRLLVVAQPDCRIILAAGERLLDVYGRAGAFVVYHRTGQEHRLAAPLELVDVLDEVLVHFTARRAAGDFIDLRLTSSEYSAFSAVARDSRALERQKREVLHALASKGALRKSGDGYELSGYVHDLAFGLASGARHVLTRHDFDDSATWRVRETTWVHVPGSLFWLNPTDHGGLWIREISAAELNKTVRAALDFSD